MGKAEEGRRTTFRRKADAMNPDDEIPPERIESVKQLRARLQHDLDFMESKSAALRAQIEGVDFVLGIIDAQGNGTP